MELVSITMGINPKSTAGTTVTLATALLTGCGHADKQNTAGVPTEVADASVRLAYAASSGDFYSPIFHNSTFKFTPEQRTQAYRAFLVCSNTGEVLMRHASTNRSNPDPTLCNLMNSHTVALVEAFEPVIGDAAKKAPTYGQPKSLSRELSLALATYNDLREKHEELLKALKGAPSKIEAPALANYDFGKKK